MKFLKILLVAAALLVLGSVMDRAEARSGFSFGYYGPGVSFQIGRYPGYYGYPYYYRPYYYSYRPRYYRSYRYRPRSYRRYRYRRSYAGRCARWSRRCAANWGYRNSNYYGCMKYHRCR